LSTSSSTQTFYPPHIWSYIKRVVVKKGGHSPNVASAITALNNYKPDSFGVTIVGTVEARKTRAGAAVIYAQFSADGGTYDVCLTLAEIHLHTSTDVRNFAPSVLKWALAPKETHSAVA